MARDKYLITNNNIHLETINKIVKTEKNGTLWIAQAPFTFEFVCNRPISNSATICNRITIRQICEIYQMVNQWLSVKLPFGHLTDFFQIWWIAIQPITLKLRCKRNLRYFKRQMKGTCFEEYFYVMVKYPILDKTNKFISYQ